MSRRYKVISKDQKNKNVSPEFSTHGGKLVPASAQYLGTNALTGFPSLNYTALRPLMQLLPSIRQRMGEKKVCVKKQMGITRICHSQKLMMMKGW